MKRVLLIVLLVLLVLGGFAGVLYGPQLYERVATPIATRMYGPTTPWGFIRQVETVRAFPGHGGPGDIRAAKGYQLWVVHFKPVVGVVPPGPEVSGQESFEKIVLLDDGEGKHSPSVWQESYQGLSEGERVVERALVFALPQEREPHSIQFGDAEAVELPASAMESE